MKSNNKRSEQVKANAKGKSSQQPASLPDRYRAFCIRTDYAFALLTPPGI